MSKASTAARTSKRAARTKGAAKPKAATKTASTPRAESKQSQLIAMLRQPDGATIAEIAKALDVACRRREFDNLILVAPRRSLGELRTLLPRRAKDCVRAEIARDLTKETPAGLFRRLKELLVPGSAERPIRSLPVRS